ncbi:cell division protein PerM [Streptosporangium sandarakinum]|uniref:cell division protein PerM n=1 Tax=Streptosporangium sandarakinum TaxID=1260955 RepID=UPI0033BD6DB5
MTALLDQLRTAPRNVLSRLPLPGVTGDDDDVRRPLPVSGMLAAAWTLGVGLAVLTTLTLVGWIASPRGSLGPGLPGVFRAAAQLWLAAHHAGFAIPGGSIGLLPLGLTVLPAFLLYRAGIWMARDADLRLRLPARLPRNSPKEQADARRRAQLVLIAQAGVSLAAPYALLAGVIALVTRNEITQPYLGDTLVSHLVLAFLAGSAAVARTIGPWRSMLRLLPERVRSVVVSSAAALGIMLVAGAALVLGAVAVNFDQVRELSDVLAPGFVGGLLLLLLQGLYLLNAFVWGMAYIAGPGFSLGAGTLVAPTGVQLGTVPSLPILGALPEAGPTPAWVMAVIALPFAAGAVAGVLGVRIAPSPSYEGAPLWGFVCGVVTGAAAGALAALSGGSLGGARLSAVGPAGWEVMLSVTLEVGVAAGISAGLTNWWLIFRGHNAAVVRAAARVGTATAPVRRAGARLFRAAGAVAGRVGLAEPDEPRALPGHWLDATECDTQPIPVIRDDWEDEHASAADPQEPAETTKPVKTAKAVKTVKPAKAVKPTEAGPRVPRPAPPRPPRRDIVDESDDRGGHVIYVDPYAWDRD